MFITVELTGNIPKNTAVSYDASRQKWAVATNTSQLIGVIRENAYQDEETSKWYAPVGISGLDCYMIALSEIPAEGGFMHVQDGKVYVDNSSMGCGIVSPQNINEATRNPDDLILVHLR